MDFVRLTGLMLMTCGLSAGAEIPARGELLVASSFSSDPELGKTVVLMLRSDPQGAVGLTLNLPSPVAVATLFPQLKSARAQSMVIYKGGPLRMGINALVRSNRATPGRSLVFGGVYLISEKAEIERLVRDAPAEIPIRVYVGLCGWTRGQLAEELGRGVWSVQKASDGVVFDGHPESLWSRLGK